MLNRLFSRKKNDQQDQQEAGWLMPRSGAELLRSQYRQQVIKSLWDLTSLTKCAGDGLERVLGQQQALQRRIVSGGEAYPEIMSEPVVREFQDTMRETEDYLAFLRDAHLKSCELYNTRIATFPDLLARPLGFQPVSLTLSPYDQEASRS